MAAQYKIITKEQMIELSKDDSFMSLFGAWFTCDWPNLQSGAVFTDDCVCFVNRGKVYVSIETKKDYVIEAKRYYVKRRND